MRAGAVVAGMGLLLLAACGQEPSFDERYDAAQKKVGQTAVAMDAEMRRADSTAAADQRAIEAARREGAMTPNPPR